MSSLFEIIWEDKDNSNMNDEECDATEAKSGLCSRSHNYPIRNNAGRKFSVYLQLHFL